MVMKIVFILILMFSFVCKVDALSIYDMQVKLKEMEEYNNSSNNLDLYSIKKDLEVINNDIFVLEEEIDECLEEINNYSLYIEDIKIQTNEYLKALQVSNLANEYLEYIFSSSSYTEFIYKYGVVSQLTEYNNNLVNLYKENIGKLNTKKDELLESKSKLENLKKEYVSKLNVIRSNSDEVYLGGSLVEDIVLLKNKIAYYKSMGYGLYDEVNELNANTNINTNTNTKWSYPLKKGCVTNNYVNNLDINSNHYGIDLDCVDEGSEVYSVNKGIVSYVGKYSCGGNFIYIYHNVNSVEYTSVYMHLLSVNVSVGDVVDGDTVIGLMGGYSTSTLHGGYDKCSNGAHLHFGISYGHNITTDLFNVNSIDPRNILSFPLMYYDSREFFYK